MVFIARWSLYQGGLDHLWKEYICLQCVIRQFQLYSVSRITLPNSFGLIFGNKKDFKSFSVFSIFLVLSMSESFQQQIYCPMSENTMKIYFIYLYRSPFVQNLFKPFLHFPDLPCFGKHRLRNRF